MNWCGSILRWSCALRPSCHRWPTGSNDGTRCAVPSCAGPRSGTLKNWTTNWTRIEATGRPVGTESADWKPAGPGPSPAAASGRWKRWRRFSCCCSCTDVYLHTDVVSEKLAPRNTQVRVRPQAIGGNLHPIIRQSLKITVFLLSSRGFFRIFIA